MIRRHIPPPFWGLGAVIPRDSESRVDPPIGCRMVHPPDDSPEPSFSLEFLPPDAVWARRFCVPFEVPEVGDARLCCGLADSVRPDESCDFPSLSPECEESNKVVCDWL